MLDAITIGAAATSIADSADSVWITWCDQVGVHPRTVARLARHGDNRLKRRSSCRRFEGDPYIHLERDGAGRISRVLHRREGDVMPQTGESDMGLFALSAEACFHLLRSSRAES